MLKRKNCKCHIQFVENCRSADVIPKFLNFRIPNSGSFEPTAMQNFQRKLLKEELFKAKKALAEHESKVFEKRNILKSVLPSKLLPLVLLFARVKLYNRRENVEATHTKNGKVCRKNKGVHCFIYMIPLNCSNLILYHQNIY